MSWGNKLLFTFIVFASGMGYLVYRSMHVNFELVEKDYYKSELRYQQVIDGTNRVNHLNTDVLVKQNQEGIILQLPGGMNYDSLTGDIWFYCAYDQTKDKKFILHTDKDGSQQFPPVITPGNTR